MNAFFKSAITDSVIGQIGRLTQHILKKNEQPIPANRTHSQGYSSARWKRVSFLRLHCHKKYVTVTVGHGAFILATHPERK
jgi:hypothetical protein